jgi:imidazolonepropionase-like amidohydrolase
LVARTTDGPWSYCCHQALGVIQEGDLADLLLVDGNPLEDIRLVETPASNFVVIMKHGTIYKNLLQ